MVVRKNTLPDIIGGYEVFKGKISFARPSDYAQNLIKNPRMWNTTGYTPLGNTDLTCVHTDQYRGIFSLYCSGSTGSYNGVCWGTTLSRNQKYKFSLDIKAKANSNVYLYLDTTGNQTPANAQFIKFETANGRWQRLSWEFLPIVSGGYAVVVATDMNVPFYTDGWLLTASDDVSGEPETYFDGDTNSFTLKKDYNWSGARNNSYSIRRAGSGASGREVFLSDLGFVTQGTVGLGKNPVTNIATPLPTGGGYYKDTIPAVREIALAGKIFSNSRAEFMNIRRNLIDLFKPDRTPTKQPMLMRIYNLDIHGNPTTPVLEAPVVYSGGLEGSYVSDFSETIQLSFVQYDPALLEDKFNAEEFTETLVSSDGVNFANDTGEIETIALPSDAGFTVSSIRSIIQSENGEIYAGGRIDTYENVIKYNGTSWESVGDGYGTESRINGVYAMKEFSKKYIAIGGDDTNYPLVVYNRTNWSKITPTCTPPIYAMEVKDSTLYLGGSFSGYLSTYYAGSMSTSPVSDEPNDTVRCLLLSRDKTKLFMGGDFSAVGSTTARNIAYYDFEESEWFAMGSGVGEAGDSVYAIAEGLDGTVYACGSFDTIQDGSVQATYIARFRWKDAEWSALENESHWNEYAYDEFDYFNALTVDRDGVLYLGGKRTAPSSYANSPKTSLFRYANGSIIVPAHYLTGTVNALYSSFDGIWIGSVSSLQHYEDEVNGFAKTVHDCYVDVENMASYPEFHIRGAGILFAITNHTTKQTIYFNALPLYLGDHLIVKVDPINGLVLSGVTNAINYLSAGSDDSFHLSPGTNHLSISFESRYEFLAEYETQLQGFSLAGLNSENTNNGQHFYINHDFNSVITVQIRDYTNSTVLAQGTKTTMISQYITLNEQNNSGVSGNIWVEGDTSDYNAEIAVGLASVVWKNRHWSISEDTE